MFPESPARSRFEFAIVAVSFLTVLLVAWNLVDPGSGRTPLPLAEVAPVPPLATAIVVPVHVPDVIVPTVLIEDWPAYVLAISIVGLVDPFVTVIRFVVPDVVWSPVLVPLRLAPVITPVGLTEARIVFVLSVQI